ASGTAQAAAPAAVPGLVPRGAHDEGGLLGRIELIEAQPLPQRAAGFEQLHDELLAELQRGDHGGS
ncbi:MAG: hypothetical protein QM606_11170, partial [Leucobacter sp.]